MDAIDLLKKDHTKVAQLFRRFNDGGGLTGAVKRLTGNAASPRQRRTVAEQICRDLDVHAGIEEAVFYPAVRNLDDGRLNEMLDEAKSEHGSIKERVGKARATMDDDDGLRAAIGDLQDCVDHHVREEENEMFPRVEERMPESERSALGRRLAADKKRFVAAPGARRPTPRTAATRKGKAAATRGAVRSRARSRGTKTGTKARKRRTAGKRRAGRR